MAIRPKRGIPGTPFRGVNPMRSSGMMPGRRIARRLSPRRIIRRFFSFLISLIVLAVILFLAYRNGMI